MGALENTAEEFADGAVALYSSDLELVSDGVGAAALQTVLIVFDSVALPPRARVGAAFLVFAIDEVNAASHLPIHLTLHAERSAAATMPSAVPFSVSARARTHASVDWTPPPSTTVGEELRTPDLRSVVQEVTALRCVGRLHRPARPLKAALTASVLPVCLLAATGRSVAHSPS